MAPLLYLPLALAGYAIMTLSSADSARGSAPTADPPQLQTPAAAAQSCSLPRLPASPTEADLEVGYELRGAQILECDSRRQLAVDVHEQEHRLEAAWKAQREARRKPWWKIW